MSPEFQMIAETALAGESELPRIAPLTLTRNFGMLVVFCVLPLCTAPGDYRVAGEPAVALGDRRACAGRCLIWLHGALVFC